jgi:uncharacterized protein YqhQ
MVFKTEHKDIHVGGQAVIEGVMMRAPKSMAIALRRPNGEWLLHCVVQMARYWSRRTDGIPCLSDGHFSNGLLSEAALSCLNP